MENQQTNYSGSYNWRKFFKISGSAFLIGLGIVVAVNSNKLIIIASGFAISGMGAALIISD